MRIDFHQRIVLPEVIYTNLITYGRRFYSKLGWYVFLRIPIPFVKEIPHPFKFGNITVPCNKCLLWEYTKEYGLKFRVLDWYVKGVSI